ncbi:MAG TPA: hypothetical protein PLA68_02460 [Panacibacter sp.]|nr:hypothetical protein [Panacibacter sp.]
MQLFKNTTLYTLFVTVTILLLASSLYAQRTQLNYKVMQGGNNIGWVKLDKKDSANTSLIKLGSEIKKRMLFMFTIIENQEAYFQNGIMMRSYVYRRINKDVKTDKRTLYDGTQYKVSKEKSTSQVTLNHIDNNFLSLYFSEPINLRQVYSDNFEQLLTIEKTTGGFYKINLPDGNTTSYYYTNGICSKVKVEQSLFTVEFVLM